jgi:hypothetical protein
MVVGYTEEAESCFEADADGVADAETETDTEELLDSGMEDESCLLAEADAETEGLCVTWTDDDA